MQPDAKNAHEVVAMLHYIDPLEDSLSNVMLKNEEEDNSPL